MAAAACYHLPWEEISHRPPLSLLQLCRERIVLMSLRAVRRIQSGGRLGWLGWPFTCIPNFEPKAFKRHGIRQLQSYLTSVPHMYNELVSGTSQCGNLRIFPPPRKISNPIQISGTRNVQTRTQLHRSHFASFATSFGGQFKNSTNGIRKRLQFEQIDHFIPVFQHQSPRRTFTTIPIFHGQSEFFNSFEIIQLLHRSTLGGDWHQLQKFGSP